nr:hypothetical protein [Deltaproteobacteria bacterium]
MKRLLVLAPMFLALSAGCDGDGSSLPTDSAPGIDARIIDAPVVVDGRPIDGPLIDGPLTDAPMMTDAAAGSITTACMHACTAIGVCFMDSDAGCVGEC